MPHLWFILSAFAASSALAHPTDPLHIQKAAGTMFADVKVPIHLGVMSRCPDAVLCESVFDKVLPRVIGKIDLSLVYIAHLDPADEDFGVKCMHGAQECAGNIQQLCVSKYTTAQEWWAFVQCQNYHGRESVGDPDLALSCAGASKIDWEGSGVGQCAGNDASGKAPEGIAMLKESLQLAQNLDINKSCTVLINKKAVCVHDGTWKDCEKGHDVNDFVKQIEEEYEHLNELN
ncbi:hypothetical protein PC9H_005381 [Pleurotus ostreatus]|uniref:Uncharacterized protein n=2 Tax=Pleurotus ostreatus TaxID=5322 RepID=A0A8H6ZZS9_PLEOS|nr:uncharacterized protein PC9H_005381 [Pleurotus ostreatus]KAF7433429.1 hypothetical protein PC9H_005381 [Pleurotus ostreatus]